MDWSAAIEKHRKALVLIVASLAAMAGLGEKPVLPRRLRLAVLRLLRPAESATRRLVIALARGLVVTLPRKVNPPQGRSGTGIPTPPAAPAGRPALRPPSLPLFDPLQHPFRLRRPKQNGVPRICWPGITEPFPITSHRPPAFDDPIDAGRLGRRLDALAAALDDLPRQALRFARWRLRRDAECAQDKNRDAAGAQDKNRDAAGAQDRKTRAARRFRRFWPLRMGRPPGSRRRPSHEVHEVLAAAHGLAFLALHPDTS